MRITFLFSFLLCTSCLADRRGQISQQRVSGWVDPSGSNTLYAWWVAADLPIGTNFIWDSNPWIDRVQNILLQKSGPTGAPTNDVDGLRLYGNQSYLTNTPLAPGANSTACIIYKPHVLT